MALGLSESNSDLQRETDENGFFKLTDEEIEQIMTMCKPLPEDISVHIDPSAFCGILNNL